MTFLILQRLDRYIFASETRINDFWFLFNTIKNNNNEKTFFKYLFSK